MLKSFSRFRFFNRKMSSGYKPISSMPGFNVPLNDTPNQNVVDRYSEGFIVALDSSTVYEELTTHRELVMMRFMNSITEKPEWDRKVFDKEIIAKWRNEMAQSGQDVSPKMLDWMFEELQWKAEVLKDTGQVRVFDRGVVRSDTAISKDVQEALKKAVKPLEDVPEEQKDYHPGSKNQVVDLVHPSLFPVVYGQTRVLAEKIIDRENCLHHVGQGELLPVPPAEHCAISKRDAWGDRAMYNSGYRYFSDKFQWLPCDVELLDDDKCRIVSYINNAHPVHHKALYDVVEQIIARSVPLWENSLSLMIDHRIDYEEVEYEEHPEPGPIEPEDEDLLDEYYEENDRWLARQPIKLPEPGKFFVRDFCDDKIDLRKHFPDTKMQVIVKLANIELTPENPNYDGGSWHIEGQLNERICATAIYYYDSDNITENTLDFRQRGGHPGEDMSYEQQRHEFLQAVFGYGDDVDGNGGIDTTQNLGGVSCKESRLLTFPNTVQHRVSSFSLADPSKPGHRKILALFLVDPHRRIISSANVPPQREDWGHEKQALVDQALSRLPVELQDMAKEGLHEFMTMEEAKKFRLELMEERGMKSEAINEEFEMADFGLCEH